jgi:YegS/Rv2252/BmrU family lipid kinase
VPAPTLVIVNPSSHAGATGRRWKGIEAKLREALGGFEVEITRGPREAERLAREGARAGIRQVILAGGDGTANEVVTGLLTAGVAEVPRLGLLPLGTASDVGRALGLPRDVDAAIARLATSKSQRIDAGSVRFRGRDGRQVDGYFLNIASFGLSGLAADLVNRGTKVLGARPSYVLAALRAIASYRNAEASIWVDGDLVHEGPFVLGAAANGRFFGGGMLVAPPARMNDGLLDVVIVAGLSKRSLLRNLPSIYRGVHLRHPAVLHRRGRRVDVRAEPGRVWMEVDGEARGTLPARFEILPDALELLGAAP